MCSLFSVAPQLQGQLRLVEQFKSHNQQPLDKGNTQIAKHNTALLT